MCSLPPSLHGSLSREHRQQPSPSVSRGGGGDTDRKHVFRDSQPFPQWASDNTMHHIISFISPVCCSMGDLLQNECLGKGFTDIHNTSVCSARWNRYCILKVVFPPNLFSAVYTHLFWRNCMPPYCVEYLPICTVWMNMVMVYAPGKQNAVLAMRGIFSSCFHGDVIAFVRCLGALCGLTFCSSTQSQVEKTFNSEQCFLQSLYCWRGFSDI